MPGLARAALIALACTLLAPAGGQAAPATLKGKLTGVKLPAAGKGVSSVRAMNVNTSVVLAARYTNRAGAFRLRVPAGAYGLLAAVVPFDGPKVIEKLVGRVRLKAGKTRSVKLAVKKKRRHKRPAHTSGVPDGFGDVAVNYPAIAVRPFKSTNPGEQYLGNGIADMLITDLLEAIAARPPCKAILVERNRIDEVLQEIRRSQGPLFDPGTRPQVGKIIKDNAKVTGTIEHANGVIKATATYTDLKTGKTTSFAKSAPDSDPNGFFTMERELAKRLAKHICDPPPLPNLYGGTFSGKWDAESTGEHWTYTGNVELHYVRPAATPPPGAPPGAYRDFEVVTGTADVSVTAQSPFGCGFEGSGQVQLDPGQGSGYLSVQDAGQPPISYFVGLQSPAKSMTVTKTGSDPSCNAGEQVQYPLPGIWISTKSAHTSASTTLADQEDRATPESPYDYDSFSKWSLTPH